MAVDFGLIGTKIKIKLSEDVIIECTGGNTEEAYNILGCSVNEEMMYKDGTPIGCVSSNSLSLKISNTNGYLSPQNSSSPYYGLIEEGVEIQVYKTYDNINYTEFGTYYVKSWSNGTGDYGYAPVDIQCMDWIGLHSEDLMKYRHISNQDNILSFLKSVLDTQQIDCNGYNIRYTSSYKVDFGCITVDKLGAFLANVAKGLCCYVYMDRHNRLCIDDVNINIGNVVDEINGTNVVYKGRSLDNNKTYGCVKVVYKGYTRSDKKELLKMENVKFNSGENSFRDIHIASGKIYVITSIVIQSKETELSLSEFNYNQNRLTMLINSSAICEGSITVYGCELVEGMSEVSSDIPNKKTDEFKIESDFIQNETYAKNVATKIANIISSKNGIIELNTSMSPDKSIGELVKVRLNAMQISGVYRILGMKMALGSSYRNDITLLRVGDINE